MPNLFKWATKELSQDALICWLIEWAGHDTDGEMHALGRSFVEALISHRRDTGPVDVPAGATIEICRQDHGIDVLARINKRHVLLIEDKTDSHPHGDQLARYAKHVLSGASRLGDVRVSDLYAIYFKTGNQSLAAERRIEAESGYRVFNRLDFLAVLERYPGSNSIVLDYRAHLRDLEKRTQAFREWTDDGSDGDWAAWEGLFRELEERLFRASSPTTLEWGYVPNPSGGFLGFSWRPEGVDPDGPAYLQLEWGHLCFKVRVASASADEQNALKWEWHEKITSQDKRIVKPSRMRRGRTMTVAVHEDGALCYADDGRLDLDRTVERLRECEEILRRAVA